MVELKLLNFVIRVALLPKSRAIITFDRKFPTDHFAKAVKLVLLLWPAHVRDNYVRNGNMRGKLAHIWASD